MKITIKAADYGGRIPEDVTRRIAECRFKGLCRLLPGGIGIDFIEIEVESEAIEQYIRGHQWKTH